ncbi:MAG: hypothetical protein ACXABC_15430 [Candidatus Thorarchaeota archaeon]|jgi:hypothetical protein
MAHCSHHKRRAVGFVGSLIVSVAVFSGLPVIAVGQNTLSLSLDRNVGIGLGSLIQGTFTLRGSGPENITSLTVYFNGEEVHSVTSNSISWQFNTADYPSGSTNITLTGLDDQGTRYRASTDVFFLGGMLSNLITVGILGFVTILIILKYGPRLIKSRK